MRELSGERRRRKTEAAKADMPSQICPLCNQEAPSTARFCPNCASPLGPEGSSPAKSPTALPSAELASRTPTQLDYAARKSQRLLVIVLVAGLILVAGIAAYSLHQTSLLNAEQQNLRNAPSIIGAQPSALSGTSVVAGQKTPLPSGSPVLGAQAKPGVTVPPAILDYLDFLGKIEAQRISLKNNVNGALSMLGAAKSMEGATESDQQQGANSQLNSGYSDYTQQWQTLTRDFQTKQPPPDCESLANSYYRLLQDYSAYISQIQVAMQNKDMNTLMNLQGSAEGQVNTDAINADSALAALCQKYSIQKPFNIPPDSGGSGTSLLGP
jgi:hypothetical protein